MADKKSNSRALRNFAEGFFDGLSADGRILQAEKDDFVTSMVRQWITYDGNATWFFGEEQVYCTHRHTPLGKPLLETKRREPGWFAEMRRDWKIDPEEFPGVIEQLNRGQSAEVTNTEGVPLRLWVNPKERSSGVESLVAQPRSPDKRDYHTIATNELLKHLGIVPDKEELEALACSVAMQWQQFQGHACIFLDRGHQLVLTLVELNDGGCRVGACKEKGDLGPLLSSLGFALAAIPEVVAHINLGQAIEFRNREGVVSILRHDPKEKRILVHPKDKAPDGAKFKLGQLEIEPRASLVLARSGEDASRFLRRHAGGDWGEASDKMKAEFDYRLKNGEAVTSCFTTNLGEKILVSTTADRKWTVVSAPDPKTFNETIRKILGP